MSSAIDTIVSTFENLDASALWQPAHWLFACIGVPFPVIFLYVALAAVLLIWAGRSMLARIVTGALLMGLGMVLVEALPGEGSDLPRKLLYGFTVTLACFGAFLPEAGRCTLFGLVGGILLGGALRHWGFVYGFIPGFLLCGSLSLVARKFTKVLCSTAIAYWLLVACGAMLLTRAGYVREVYEWAQPIALGALALALAHSTVAVSFGWYGDVGGKTKRGARGAMTRKKRK